MSLAQKKARENFKKAIAYRKKTGCSLKQAFAYVKTGKVGAYKVIEKGESKNAKVTKVLQQKRTKTGKFASIKRVAGVKKAAKKKPVNTHKDTKSHNVNIRVVSGIKARPTIVLLAKKIANDTNNNNHTEAVLRLAKFLKDKEAISLLNSIKRSYDVFGYMPKQYLDSRSLLLKMLLQKAKMKLPGVDYELIYKSF